MAPDETLPIGRPLLSHELVAVVLVVLVDLAPLPKPTPTVLAPVPCGLAVVLAACSGLLGIARAPSCIAAVLTFLAGFLFVFRPGARFVCVARKRIWIHPGQIRPFVVGSVRVTRSWITSRPVSLCLCSAGRLLIPDCPCFRLLGFPSPSAFACVWGRFPLFPVLAHVARRSAARDPHRERCEHHDRGHCFPVIP